jgi:AraC-like DNA-binding protein
MSMNFEQRLSDSPLVECIWRSNSDYATPFTSVAACHWEMVVTRLNGQLTMTLRGPETHATPAWCPPEGEWVGILFKLGTSLEHLPVASLVDNGINLPDASGKSFWLKGGVWQFPDYENADTFVDRLVREDLLVREPLVEAALQNRVEDLSPRSVQRRFLQATGLTQGTVRQIERARSAAVMLRQGVSILDTVVELGYSDQPHLTRALKHYAGLTPGQLANSAELPQLSFLFDGN